MRLKRVILMFILLGGFCLSGLVRAEVFEVMATVETDPVPHAGDRADDATVWVHPTDPNRSVIIGTDKDDTAGGLVVYDLAGKQMSFTTGGKMNNVDVRYNFPLGGKEVDIIAVGNRTDDSIAVYTID
ncbi:MAG: phytase, partial [Phycisphaerae bacterium]|nr:phytase [Phycisphaerae bacterium]